MVVGTGMEREFSVLYLVLTLSPLFLLLIPFRARILDHHSSK